MDDTQYTFTWYIDACHCGSFKDVIEEWMLEEHKCALKKDLKDLDDYATDNFLTRFEGGDESYGKLFILDKYVKFDFNVYCSARADEKS